MTDEVSATIITYAALELCRFSVTRLRKLRLSTIRYQEICPSYTLSLLATVQL